MPKKPAYFLLPPQDLIGRTLVNHHVFDGTYDTDSDTWRVTATTSRCGNIDKLYGKTHSTEKSFDEKKFCIKVIEGHDHKFNVCGACMATFFSDTDD